MFPHREPLHSGRWASSRPPYMQALAKGSSSSWHLWAGTTTTLKSVFRRLCGLFFASTCAGTRGFTRLVTWSRAFRWWSEFNRFQINIRKGHGQFAVGDNAASLPASSKRSFHHLDRHHAHFGLLLVRQVREGASTTPAATAVVLSYLPTAAIGRSFG